MHWRSIFCGAGKKGSKETVFLVHDVGKSGIVDAKALGSS